jgi:peptidoglycan/LPS O-acetylase OafA/YrhL
LLQHRKGYLPTLDGWRALAIAAVLIDHVVAESYHYKHPTLFALTRVGPNGVSLFFAISGFLICSRLIEEEELLGSINLKGFYLRRACRILPAAFSYLAMIGVLGMLGLIGLAPIEWWSCIFFFRNYLRPDSIHLAWGGYTIHYWSLAVEEHFYLFWPAAMAFLGRRRACYVAGGLAIAVALWRWWDWRHGWFERLIPGLMFGSRTDVRLDALLLGCLAALIVADSRWRTWLTRKYAPPIWYALAIAYAMFQVISRRHMYTIWESALLASLVAGTVLRPSTMIGRVLETPVFKWVGRLSYSLYLWQQLFLVPGALYPLSVLQRAPLDLAVVFGMAYLSYQYIERPMIRLGHRLAPPPTPGRTDLGQVRQFLEGKTSRSARSSNRAT